MDSGINPVEVLFAESQRLEVFTGFWEQRYGPPKFVP